MKFMKLGSKPDQFQTDGENIRYVATELASDIVVNVGHVKFYLHKFPLLSKSCRLQKLVAGAGDENNAEIDIHDIMGGPAAFEICAKFCYGMVATLNAYNVVAARCAAEYLEMYETVEKGNLIYKIDIFLTSSIFRSWKDSIIVLRTSNSFLPLSEELKIISHGLEAVATKASFDPSKVDWSYTYNSKKLLSENGNDTPWNGVKKQPTVPNDWWVEDLCELQVNSFKRVITAIRAKQRISEDTVGESLRAYTLRRLPNSSKNTRHVDDLPKYRYLIETITGLLPAGKNCVPCSFLLKLLQASIILECGDTGRRTLTQKVAWQLEEATVGDLLQCCTTDETSAYDIDLVHDLVEQFVMREQSARQDSVGDSEFQKRCTGFTSEDSRRDVARLVDGYLAEAAGDLLLPLSKFTSLAETVSSFPRSTHDGIYRAIDVYLKEHPGLSKSEKKRICSLMDCSRLSANACAHAVQNERLPLRVVVQVLFFEQSKSATPTSDLSARVCALLPGPSNGSSSSATTANTDDGWDSNQTSEELKVLKEDFSSMRLNSCRMGGETDMKAITDKVVDNKVKKIFSKLWSHKDRIGENSSDSSETPTFINAEETRSTPSSNRMKPY